MKRLKCSPLVMAVSLVLGFYSLLVPQAHAAKGRDFAGFYTLTDAAQSGQDYTITFTALVFNYYGADLSDVTLVLRDSPGIGAVRSSFPHINITSNSSVHLSTKISIPAPMYAHWQHGGRPELLVEFTSTNGEKQLEHVELMPDHGGLTRAN
jgi:hypothetical protein